MRKTTKGTTKGKFWMRVTQQISFINFFLKSSYTWSSIPVSHKGMQTCLDTAASAARLFRKHCVLVKDTASAVVSGGGRGTLQQLEWISRGLGGCRGGSETAGARSRPAGQGGWRLPKHKRAAMPCGGTRRGREGVAGFLAHRPSATGWGGRRTSTSSQITLSCPYDIQRKNAWKENSGCTYFCDNEILRHISQYLETKWSINTPDHGWIWRRKCTGTVSIWGRKSCFKCRRVRFCLPVYTNIQKTAQVLHTYKTIKTDNDLYSLCVLVTTRPVICI